MSRRRDNLSFSHHSEVAALNAFSFKLGIGNPLVLVGGIGILSEPAELRLGQHGQHLEQGRGGGRYGLVVSSQQDRLIIGGRLRRRL